jgi:hypothetical protein
MKQLLLNGAILFLLSGFLSSVSAQQTQTLQQDPVQQKIEAVYGISFAADNPGMYQHMYQLLLGRVHYIRQREPATEKYPKLSEFALLTKNNPALTRDQVFNEATFNPLKYQLNFFPKTTQIYRFDNSDILIVIDPF